MTFDATGNSGSNSLPIHASVNANANADDTNAAANNSNNIASTTTPDATTTCTPPLRLIDDAPPFFHDKHVHYVATLAEKLERSFEGALTNHLRLSGVYWSVCAMFLLCGDDLKTVDELMGLVTAKQQDCSSDETDNNNNNKKTTCTSSCCIVDWIDTCFDETTGAYGGDTGQDGHVLYTLSALQVLAMADCLDRVPNKERVVHFLASLQQPDGSFVGDASMSSSSSSSSYTATAAEVDTRFTYCALSALSILNRLDAIDMDRAVAFVQKCYNPLDGGYGSCIGAESHAGQVFCCIGALSIAQALLAGPPESTTAMTERKSNNHGKTTQQSRCQELTKLSWWLSERQCDSGGLNGRSEKQADVCYSWWILSSMSLLGVVQYIDGAKLASFILKAQDPEDGGIADRPDDMADVFHTFFGISGLSLLGYLPDDSKHGNDDDDEHVAPQFGQIDPVYALPVSVVKRLGLQAQVLVRSGTVVDERVKGYNVVVVDEEFSQI